MSGRKLGDLSFTSVWSRRVGHQVNFLSLLVAFICVGGLVFLVIQDKKRPLRFLCIFIYFRKEDWFVTLHSALLQRGGHLDTGRILGAFSWWLEALDEARGAVGGGNCMVELVDYRIVWYGNCMEDYGMGW